MSHVDYLVILVLNGVVSGAMGRAVGSKNELVRPYSHFETLVQAPLIDLVGNQEQ